MFIAGATYTRRTYLSVHTFKVLVGFFLRILVLWNYLFCKKNLPFGWQSRRSDYLKDVRAEQLNYGAPRKLIKRVARSTSLGQVSLEGISYATGHRKS